MNFISEFEKIRTNENLNEILILSHNNIWVENSGELKKTDCFFESETAYRNFLQNLFIEAQVRPDLETPTANGYWNGFRLHYIQKPICPEGPVLSLRRRNTSELSLNDLCQSSWAPEPMTKLIHNLIQEKKTLLIAGATGSGKTTALNIFLKSVRPNERVITIEDTDEIILPNEASTKLLTRTKENSDFKCYDQADLVKQSLRMRPDRLVLGEVRGAEAKDLLLAFSSGHNGGLATLHAESARQALLRLELLIQMGAPQWSLYTIRNLIQTSVYAIVGVEKFENTRRLSYFSKISSVEETGFCLETIYQAAY